jgi:hypothetical protein
MLSVVLLTGCAVELDDRAGRACDDEHPCRAPRACVEGLCVEPGPTDAGGGAGGGGGASGGGSGGGGGVVDAGTPRWQQRLHGFTNTTVDPGAMLDIDPSRGNRVLATIPGPRDGEDTAQAELVDLNRLPRTLEGRLRGRITLPAPVGVRGFVPLVFLGTQSGTAFLRAGFDHSGQLVVESDAQTLGDAALTERFQVDGGFTTGDWVVEFAWAAGTSREVWINGLNVATTRVTGGASTPPSELALGIARYDGDAGGPFSVTLSGWQLADELSARLGDVP